jgi:F-type H+-transporting ATPase subunit b
MSLTSAEVLLLSASAEGGGGLANIDWGLFIWTLVLFAVFATILARFGWKPLLKMIDEREHGVREAVEGAQRANAEAEALLIQHKELLREANRERAEVLKQAAQEAERVKTEIVAAAKVEAAIVVERAKQDIERQRAAAVADLRGQVADLAVEAAAKIVTTSLTLDVQRKLVDEFITGMPTKLQ